MSLVLLYTLPKTKDSSYYYAIKSKLEENNFRHELIDFYDFGMIKTPDVKHSEFHTKIFTFDPMIVIVPYKLYTSSTNSHKLIKSMNIMNGHVINDNVMVISNKAHQNQSINSAMNFIYNNYDDESLCVIN